MTFKQNVKYNRIPFILRWLIVSSTRAMLNYGRNYFKTQIFSSLSLSHFPIICQKQPNLLLFEIKLFPKFIKPLVFFALCVVDCQSF